MSVIHQLMATGETIEGWDVVRYSNELFFDYRNAQEHLDKFERECLVEVGDEDHMEPKMEPGTIRIQIIDRKLCDRRLRETTPRAKRGDKP